MNPSKVNRYLPTDDPDLWWYPAMRVTKVHVEGQPMLAPVDNEGRIVPFYELLEILSSIKPFYDAVTDRTLHAWNEETHRERLKAMEGGSASRPQPRDRSGYVYVLQAGPYLKIGVTKVIDRRVRQLTALPPFDLELVGTIATGDMFKLEACLHAEFADKRKGGEWFELSPDDLTYLSHLEGAAWASNT